MGLQGITFLCKCMKEAGEGVADPKRNQNKQASQSLYSSI